MGTPEFACVPLAHLCRSRHDVQAVVTGPDQPAGRGNRLSPTAVCDAACGLGLEVLRPDSLKDETLYERLKAYDPDLIVVVAFKILPQRIYSLPRLGAINLHASLLPKYRGAAPINWATINGETETGMTSFFLKRTVDTGDIILQETLPIYDDDTFDSLHERLSQASGPFLLRTLDLIQRGEVRPLPQNDASATPAPKILADDALIDFGFPARNVRNFVRGLATRPGAYTFFRSKKVKIFACEVHETPGADDRTPPGSILPERKRLIVQCAEAAVEVTSLLPEGKKLMNGASFLNGFRPEPGELLGRLPTAAEGQR